MSGHTRQPELTELETFVLAVEEGSIARAAAELGISSPAAAKRIRQLELLAQAPLLNRGRRGVRATEAGLRLYPVARDLVMRRADVVAVLDGAPPGNARRTAGRRQLLGHPQRQSGEAIVGDTQALLAAIFRATGEAIVLTRADDGLIDNVNDAATQLLGYGPEELRGRRVSEIGLWVDAHRRDELVQQAMTTRTPQQGELIARGPTGETHPVLARFDVLELQGVAYILVTLREALPTRPALTTSPDGDAAPKADRQFAARYLAALRQGKPLLAASVAEEALSSYGDVAHVHSDLIAPAMTAIGDLWERNVISVADEHLATEISQKVAARLFFSVLRDSPRRRERVLMAAVQGEHHVLGLRLVADVLEGSGYDVLYLGADVPVESLLDACRAYGPQVLGLTATMPLNIPTLVWEIGEVGKLERAPQVMIGGRAAATAAPNELAHDELSHVAYARQSGEVLEVLARLLADERTASRG